MAYLGKEIFPIRLYYPLTHTLVYSNTIANLGDGFEQRATKNQAWAAYSITGFPARPDGLGNVGVAYRGINQFTITMKAMLHANSVRTGSLQAAAKLWKFYQDRSGSIESFWFYNPTELEIIDSTGATNTGRYLVRFLEDNPSRELFIRNLYNSGITLIEVRS